MDREKVIKGLEHCKKYGSLGGNDCNGHYEYTDNLQEIIKANNHRKNCPYGQCRTGCVVTLVADVLTLLKEQAPAKDENSHRRPAYICDPEKNTSCTKEGCMIFHFCRCTTNKEFAKTGENNKPIVAVRSDMDGEE